MPVALPVEPLMACALVINRHAAQASGLTSALSLLVRADRVSSSTQQPWPCGGAGGGAMIQDRRGLVDATCIALDTETTGLFPIMHRLVEVGAVRFRLDGRELATFQQLIDPHIPIPPNVQRVHGITDAMARGQPTVEQVIPHLIDFLGESDTILLAHNVLFDLGFLAMALTRLGIAYPPHYVFDTLDMAHRLYPTWPSNSLEHVASRLNVANGAAHRALSDAQLVKDIFLEWLRHTPTLKTIADLGRLSPPLTFADTPVCAIDPPAGFEALAFAMTERCPIRLYMNTDGNGRNHA
jgi:DNA polymerase III epsilon subunit family exonuclease